jgi:hypothetical protein
MRPLPAALSETERRFVIRVPQQVRQGQRPRPPHDARGRSRAATCASTATTTRSTRASPAAASRCASRSPRSRRWRSTP